MTSERKPKWLQLTDRIMGPLFLTASGVLEKSDPKSIHLSYIPYLALHHLFNCLYASIVVNQKGQHSVAVCLIRQAVETLTLIDLGLQDDTYRLPLLEAWESGKKTQGEIRKALEHDIWPKYGHGLWDESWSEYFSNLAKAVQPYAHYSPDLMGWQMAFVAHEGENSFAVAAGPKTYDPIKATRVTLLHSLCAWTLGRLLTENSNVLEVVQFKTMLSQLRKYLGASKLLFKNKNWADELAPHVIFKPGCDWRDE